MRRVTVGVVAAVVLAAGGCGDSGGDAEPPGPTRTFTDPQEFAGAFSEVCAAAHEEADRRFEDIVEEYGDHDQRAAGAGAVAEIYEDALKQLGALVPPPALETQVDELLETLTTRARLYREWQEVAAEDDLSAEEGITDDALGEADLALAVDSNDVGVDCGIPLGVGGAEPPQEAISVFGSYPELDALAQQCFDGMFASCDALFRAVPYEEWEYSTYAVNAACSDPADRSFCDPPAESIEEFGQHPELDALATQCFDGQQPACDLLAGRQEYVDYATRCGYRVDDYLGPTCEKTLT